MPKFNLTNETSQKAIISVFQNTCWVFESGVEGNLEYIIPCIYEHTFKVSCDEEGNIKFYLLYFESHNPNTKYRIKQLTAKTYTDQLYIESMTSILLSDKSLNVSSYNINYELYISRTNHDHFHVSIYPALEVFNVEDIDGTEEYKEWQTVLSRLGRLTF